MDVQDDWIQGMLDAAVAKAVEDGHAFTDALNVEVKRLLGADLLSPLRQSEVDAVTLALLKANGPKE